MARKVIVEIPNAGRKYCGYCQGLRLSQRGHIKGAAGRWYTCVVFFRNPMTLEVDGKTEKPLRHHQCLVAEQKAKKR